MAKASSKLSKAAAFDEMNSGRSGVRESYRDYAKWLSKMSSDDLMRRHQQADMLFRRIGITFNVYGENAGGERLIPFDTIPRIIAAQEWKRLEKGLAQRIRALNLFLGDVYGPQKILKDKVVPKELVLGNEQYRKEMEGFAPPGGTYVHIGGIDLVRTGEDDFFVLEDNLRTPSGVSYMLENREIMNRLFPELFDRHKVKPVTHYPVELLTTLRACAPPGVEDPTVVLMTPGSFNAAYFEHSFLADEMGIELVQGQDLFVEHDTVYMRTIAGPKRVDVIYRRIDDDFLDPKAFRKDSMLGVPGIFEAYKKGRVTLANAVGTGIGDDKAIYRYVPEMIKYYLSEEPILANVPTYDLSNKQDLTYVLEHMAELVIKEVHGSGGYGMLVGPTASAGERSAFREKILAKPEAYIAQPTLALSTGPTLIDGSPAPRHMDLRPFILSAGDDVRLVPGGLTRVALTEGSLVVNSSQGGGTKDTWVLGS